MKNRITHIWIVKPLLDESHQAFNDMGRLLRSALSEIGIEVPIVYTQPPLDSCPIVLGANLLHHYGETKVPGKFNGVTVPKDAIIFQGEQLFFNSPWLREDYVNLLENWHVWDYSPINIEFFQKYANHEIELLEFGYSPGVDTLHQRPKVTDVCFFGSVSKRRDEIERKMLKRGIVVKHVFNEYGDSRNRMIEESQIALNMHFYMEHSVQEAVRISHLVNNGAFVLTEFSEGKHLDQFWSRYTEMVDCEDLSTMARWLLDNPSIIERKRKRNYERYKSETSMADNLMRLLGNHNKSLDKNAKTYSNNIL